MGAVLEQLGLDRTFFVQLGIFVILFLLLSRVYFKPFLRLFEARHKKTVEDRETAERLMQQARARFDEYTQRLADERLASRREYEALLNEAKKEEAAILLQAREEAKKITQEAAESVSRQRDQLRKQLESDVEALSRSVSEKLLSRQDP